MQALAENWEEGGEEQECPKADSCWKGLKMEGCDRHYDMFRWVTGAETDALTCNQRGDGECSCDDARMLREADLLAEQS
jgi:hypothetical protein